MAELDRLRHPVESSLKYIPQVGQILNITLPGEVTRGLVEERVDDDHFVVTLQQPTTNYQSHRYQKDNLVPVQRKKSIFGGPDNWEAVDERLLAAAREARDEAAQKAALEEKTKGKRRERKA